MVVFPFSVLGAAVFAEPAVTKVEEMIGLLHTDRSCSGAGGREILCSSKPDTEHDIG